MKLKLQRQIQEETFTHGELYVDGKYECFTIEDAVRDEKIPGMTAIPAGCYSVSVTHSMRFNRLLPLINNVQNFEGVRIHSGNSSADTEGCILVGARRPDDEKDWISESKKAFNALFTKILAAWNAGEKISIEIRNVER